MCKGDLLYLPKKLKAILGNLGPVVLVYQVTNTIKMVDVETLQTAEMSAEKYRGWELHTHTPVILLHSLTRALQSLTPSGTGRLAARGRLQAQTGWSSTPSLTPFPCAKRALQAPPLRRPVRASGQSAASSASHAASAGDAAGAARGAAMRKTTMTTMACP